MNKLIIAAGVRSREPIQLLAVTVAGAGLLAALAIASALLSL